jgi:Integrase zinc binding domain
MYHNHETAGHPGELETYNGIRQNYWWPGLRMFVKNYVQGCGICQQFRINQSLSNPAYIAIEGANNTRPYAKFSVDLIMDLPPVEGYNSILVVVDRGLLKGGILCPCAKTIMWEGTARLLHNNLFKRFGLPDEIISDTRPRDGNWKQSKFISFKKNQKVWLDTRNLKMSHHRKIAPKREGPFKIDKVLGPVTY